MRDRMCCPKRQLTPGRLRQFPATGSTGRNCYTRASGLGGTGKEGQLHTPAVANGGQNAGRRILRAASGERSRAVEKEAWQGEPQQEGRYPARGREAHRLQAAKAELSGAEPPRKGRRSRRRRLFERSANKRRRPAAQKNSKALLCRCLFSARQGRQQKRSGEVQNSNVRFRGFASDRGRDKSSTWAAAAGQRQFTCR